MPCEPAISNHHFVFHLQLQASPSLVNKHEHLIAAPAVAFGQVFARALP
jgi:hypothetical protein